MAFFLKYFFFIVLALTGLELGVGNSILLSFCCIGVLLLLDLEWTRLRRREGEAAPWAWLECRCFDSREIGFLVARSGA